MLHPDIELRFVSEAIGYGLFARNPIPRGTVTWVLCSLEQVFTPRVVRELEEPYQRYLGKYAYRDGRDNHILCCDLGRYMNHSCDSNTLTLPDAEIEIALRDIEAGDEVTDDYGTLNLEEDMPCLCGSSNCRGLIRTDDARRLRKAWEARVTSALADLDGVPQPLASFARGAWRERLERACPAGRGNGILVASLPDQGHPPS